MIYITQLIYIEPGKEKEFENFESVVIPLIEKYNGRLLFRLRPAEDAYISFLGERPYEVHFAEFDSEQDFRNYGNDPERLENLYLKDISVRTSMVIMGNRL
ncbi:MAG TPA: hypothetical protein VK179_06820 [Bacteroidales bacterium]|nr:hypothetical protein [Bacteroidales bacterium]